MAFLNANHFDDEIWGRHWQFGFQCWIASDLISKIHVDDFNFKLFTCKINELSLDSSSCDVAFRLVMEEYTVIGSVSVSPIHYVSSWTSDESLRECAV